MPGEAGGRGLIIMEPDLLVGREFTEVPAPSVAELAAAPRLPSLLVQTGTCPIFQSWALFLFAFGNVAAEGPRPAEWLAPQDNRQLPSHE